MPLSSQSHYPIIVFSLAKLSCYSRLPRWSDTAKVTVLEVFKTLGLSEDQISAFLISKFGLRNFNILREVMSMVPLMFSMNQLETIQNFFPSLRKFEDFPNAILLANFVSHTTLEEQRCFGLPTSRIYYKFLSQKPVYCHGTLVFAIVFVWVIFTLTLWKTTSWCGVKQLNKKKKKTKKELSMCLRLIW